MIGVIFNIISIKLTCINRISGKNINIIFDHNSSNFEIREHCWQRSLIQQWSSLNNAFPYSLHFILNREPIINVNDSKHFLLS